MAQAGAHFANLVIQAAFAGKTTVVQSYIDLEAAPGGKGVQQEIGSDLAYFSVNVELGVSAATSLREPILTPFSVTVSRTSSPSATLTTRRRPSSPPPSRSSAPRSRRVSSSPLLPPSSKMPVALVV